MQFPEKESTHGKIICFDETVAAAYDETPTRKRLPFVMVDLELSRHFKGSTIPAILAFIAFWSDWKKRRYGRNQRLYLNYQTIAEDLGISVSTVRRGVQKLSQERFICVLGKNPKMYYEVDQDIVNRFKMNTSIAKLKNPKVENQ